MSHTGVMTDAADDSAAPDAILQARGRALSSPLRLRILRLCLHEARTNRELADELGMNPGTTLHHVRSLVDTGLLRAEEPRRGRRGAREVPYRATGLSWRTPVPRGSQLLLDTFLMEIEGLDPEQLITTRLGLKLSAADREELLDRFQALFDEYAARAPDPDGTPISLFFAEHPDRRA
jgi:DNA-binding transcriptional ArsR family regulator